MTLSRTVLRSSIQYRSFAFHIAPWHALYSSIVQVILVKKFLISFMLQAIIWDVLATSIRRDIHHVRLRLVDGLKCGTSDYFQTSMMGRFGQAFMGTGFPFGPL